MRIFREAVGGALGCLAVAAASAEAAPKVTDPDWLGKPTVEQIEHAYPPVAGSLLIPGVARVECALTVRGEPTGCVVVEESPAGLGFGQAAMSLVPYFRFSPKLIGGKPVPGAIMIPIRFDPQLILTKPRTFGPPALPLPALSPSQAKLEKARTLVALLGAPEVFDRQVQRLIQEDFGDLAPDAPLRAEAEAALVRAFGARRDETLERGADALARLLTEAELDQLIAFHKGGLYAKLQQAMIASASAMSAPMNKEMTNILSDARMDFCKDRSCKETR